MTADLLAAGQRWQQAGDLPRAEQAYRQLVQQEPANAPAWFFLGTVCLVRDDLASAAASLEQALHLQPAFVEALHYRGIVFAQQGQLSEAAARLREALRLRPDDPEIRTNLGFALTSQGQYAEGIACLQAVLTQRPDHARAQALLREALARQAVGEGMACLGQGKLPEAENRFRQALRLKPDFGGAHNNLGLALRKQDRSSEAEASFRAAARLRPELAEAHNNLGLTLLDQDRLDEATVCLQHAIELQPGFAEAHNNLGNAFLHQGRLDEALESYANAAQARPDYFEARWNATIVRLMRGDFEKGLPEHELRWQLRNVPARYFAQSRWDGSPLAGRTILLYGEAIDLFLGDTIQFVRYARLVKEEGATVIVECQRALLRLLARCPGIDQLIAQGDPLPPHDVCAPLMSLPHLFGTRVDTIPADVPYLWADDALVERWRRELSGLPGFKIGIAWKGSAYADKHQRSIPLAEYAPLAAVPGVQLISLQKGPGSELLHTVAKDWPVTDIGNRLGDSGDAFMDMAAVMMNLDLVVSCDTSILHVAGALGRPVWVALKKVADWRFLLDRNDSPWYPTMRLFRQERRGDWQSVFQRMAEAVRP